MKLPLELISLQNQKVSKAYDAFIELLPDRMHYKVEFKGEERVDEEDESLGWEKVMTCWERVTKKGNICGVELDFVQATKKNKNDKSCWKVTINMFGYAHDVKIYFWEEEKARELFNSIHKWLFE